MRAHETTLTVRFNEIDSFGVVWHGHYIQYFEIGRLDLCSKFDLSPEMVKRLRLFAPVIEIKCRLRSPAKYDDILLVKTSVVPSEKAMLTFSYKLYRKSDMTLLAEGETTHVFITLNWKMLYEVPSKLRTKIEKMLEYLNGE